MDRGDAGKALGSLLCYSPLCSSPSPVIMETPLRATPRSVRRTTAAPYEADATAADDAGCFKDDPALSLVLGTHPLPEKPHRIHSAFRTC
jgi:hypothetical protein